MKRYLLFIIPVLILLTACGSNNTLKCKTEQYNARGEKTMIATNIFDFDSDTKKIVKTNLTMEYYFNTENEANEYKKSEELFCKGVGNNNGCSFKVKNKTVVIEVKELDISKYENMTKEDIKRYLEQDSKTICN